MTAKPFNFGRVIVYGVLLVAALFFLAPLYVMIVTSLKDADQIRSGNLLSLPTGLNFESWQLAWSTACTGVDCRGLQPYFWNSVAMAVPAVLISTAWGAINGYVLSMWKFKGSDVLFGFMLFGVFMPFQVVLLPMSQVLGYLGLFSFIGGLVPIGDGFVDRWFLSQVPTLELKDVQASIDPFRKIALWLYPAGDLILGYSWAPSVTNRWFTWSTTATYLTRLATSGYTWDAAGAIWATWDDMPEIPFNDRFWQGGQQFLAAIDVDYKLALYSGDNAAATIQTSTQASPVSGLISWATSIDDCATSTLTLGVTDALSTAMVFDPAKAASKTSSGRTPMRGRGKNLAFEYATAAGATWTYAKGVDFVRASTAGPK